MAQFLEESDWIIVRLFYYYFHDFLLLSLVDTICEFTGVDMNKTPTHQLASRK